mgnify:CR=1 FL=1
MTTFRVWEACHSNGQPWKIWAVAVEGGEVITWFGGVDAPRLQGGKPVKLNGKKPFDRLRELEAEKRQSPNRYAYKGEGTIIDGELEMGVPPKKAPGFKAVFWSFRIPCFDLAETNSWLNKAGASITEDSENGKTVIGIDGHTISLKERNGILSCADPVEETAPRLLVVLLSLAKRHGGTMAAPDGSPIKNTYPALKELCKDLTDDCLALATQLGLVMRALPKMPGMGTFLRK